MENNPADNNRAKEEANASKAFRLGVSPVEGNFKLGPLRTHLYNYLFAANEKLTDEKTKIYFRVDDTNLEKRDPQMAVKLFSFFTDVLGMEFDVPDSQQEKMVFQSQRKDLYEKFLEELYSSEIAFLDKNSGLALFDIEKFIKEYGETVSVNDLTRGNLTYRLEELLKKSRYFPLVRSDGAALYNLATVVDDHDMGISHIVRGNSHLSTVQFQEMIRVALDLQPKNYLHVPMLLNPKKEKQIYDSFIQQGILPQALLSYMVSSGYGDPDQVYASIGSIIDSFDYKKIRNNNGAFDLSKLNSINRKILSGIEDVDYRTSAIFYLLKTNKEELKSLLENDKNLLDLIFHLKIPFEKIEHFCTTLLSNDYSAVIELTSREKQNLKTLIEEMQKESFDPRDTVFGSDRLTVQMLRLFVFHGESYQYLHLAFEYLKVSDRLENKIDTIKTMLSIDM